MIEVVVTLKLCVPPAYPAQIGEEPGQVLSVLNGDVLDDRVPIVKMKGILKMVIVSRRYRKKYQQ